MKKILHLLGLGLLVAACSKSDDAKPATTASASYTIDGAVRSANSITFSRDTAMVQGSPEVILTFIVYADNSSSNESVILHYAKPLGSTDSALNQRSVEVIDGGGTQVKGMYANSIQMTLTNNGSGYWSGTFAANKLTNGNIVKNRLTNGTFANVKE